MLIKKEENIDKEKIIKCKLKGYKKIDSRHEKNLIWFYNSINILATLTEGISVGQMLPYKEFKFISLSIIIYALFILFTNHTLNQLNVRKEMIELWNNIEEFIIKGNYLGILYDEYTNMIILNFKDEKNNLYCKYYINNIKVKKQENVESPEFDISEGILSIP